jgi:AcrR family transcriptional regulator
MAQVKKIEVRDAILESAFDLFARQGYARTTLAQIAAGARVTPSNIYVYFASKLDLLFEVYRPWLMERLDALEARLADIADPKERLRALLYAVWRDLPQDDNGFANNLMQAVSNLDPSDRYSRDLLDSCERRVSTMLRTCLPPERQALADDRNILAHILFMAQDGLVISFKLNGPVRRMDAMVDAMCALLIVGG